jgi:hypothetical protein
LRKKSCPKWRGGSLFVILLSPPSCIQHKSISGQFWTKNPELEFLNNLWGLGTGPPGYIGWRNWSLGIIPGLHKRLKIRALGGALDIARETLQLWKSLLVYSEHYIGYTRYSDYYVNWENGFTWIERCKNQSKPLFQNFEPFLLQIWLENFKKYFL